MTSPAPVPNAAFWINSLYFEYLPNAKLTTTERDTLDILYARQEFGGVVHITQAQLAERLGVRQPNISRALAGLAERGIIEPAGMRKRGRVRIHPSLAAYPSPRHAIAALEDPDVVPWPLNIPTPSMRPPRLTVAAAASRRVEQRLPVERPVLRVVG